jgi:hypothetical protein
MATEILPANYILYRSSPSEARNAKSKINKEPNYLRNLPVFFLYGNNGEQIAGNSYGGHVTVYKTTRPLRLLDIANRESISMLLQATKNQIVIKSILKTFRITNTNIIRFSKMKYDIHVSNLVCRLGFDGYFTGRLRRKYSGTFHQEIMLCKPKTCTRVVSVSNATKPPPIQNRFGLNNRVLQEIFNIGNFSK